MQRKPKTVSEHISELMRAGHPASKAVALAQKYADGGEVKDDVPEVDPKKAKEFEKGATESGWNPERWLKNIKEGLAGNDAPQKYAAGGEVTPEDLSALEDMFGKQSPALQEALRSSRGQALQDVVGKAPLEPSILPPLANKSAAQSAEFLDSALPIPGEQLPVPTGSEAGFQTVGGPYGGPPPVAAEAPIPTGNLPAVRGGMPAVTEGGLPAAAGEGDAIATTGRVLGAEAAPTAAVEAVPGVIQAAALGHLAGKGAEYVGTGAAEQDLHDLLNPKKPYDGSIPLPAEPSGPGMSSRPGDANGPSLFSMVSDAYKNHAPEMMGPPAPAVLARGPAAAPAAAPAAPSAPVPATTPPAMNPLLAKYLQDREDMKGAQEKANTNRLIAGIAGAGSQLAASTYASTKPVDEAGIKALQENAGAPVAALQATQEAGMKGLQTQTELMKAQEMQEDMNPNSPKADALRKIYSPILAKSGIPTDVMKGMGAADIKSYAQNPTEFMLKMKEIEAQKAATLELTRGRLQDKARIEDEKDATAIANKLNYLSASSRSALGSAANAKTSVARLIDIAQRPDATNEDMQSVYGDLNRVVSNTTTMSGTEHQAYSNLQTKLAGYMSALSSNPVPAQIPEIKQHIIDVAKGMDKISDNVLAHNSRMVQVGHEGWIQRHPDQWQAMLAAQSGEAPAAPTGGVTSGGVVPGAGSSPALRTLAPGEVARLTADGKTAVFDATTKKFLRYQ